MLPAGLASVVGTGAKSIVLHDFNHDGALDAAIGLWLYHPSLVVLLNDGLGGYPTRHAWRTTAFADGAAHAVPFTYRHPDPLPANFTVDDVRLVDREASSSGASDGLLRLWIDGASAGDLAGLDNARSGVGFVRLGALSVKTGALGPDPPRRVRLHTAGPRRTLTGRTSKPYHTNHLHAWTLSGTPTVSVPHN